MPVILAQNNRSIDQTFIVYYIFFNFNYEKGLEN